MKKRKWTKILALLLVLAAAAAVVLPRVLVPVQSGVLAPGMNEYIVSRADVSVTITGSGQLEVGDSLEIDMPAGVEVSAVFAESGDIVSEGEILALLDVDSLEYRAAELSSELTMLDLQLSARREADQIVSPVKGRIKQIWACEDGDVIETINKHGALAVISTDGLMQIEIKTETELSMNAEVDVKWNGGTEDGVVAAKTQNGYLITLDDEDAPYLAEADVYYNVEKIASGTLMIHAPLRVIGNGGTIEKIHKEADDEITAGAKLFTLANAPAADAYRQTLADRREKAEQLQNVLALLANPHITAPESGIVQAVFVKEGEKAVSADYSAEAAAFTLGTGGAVKMTVDVDELDIPAMQTGQSAVVTLDAFAGESFSATVERISYLGQSAGSVTTYAVELRLDPDERLYPGMNGSAVIHSETAHDALIVPLAAISEDGEGEYVLVCEEDGSQTRTYIETGLSDGTNAQVLRGLSEGETIVYRATASGLLLMQQRMMENQAAMFGGME